MSPTMMTLPSTVVFLALIASLVLLLLPQEALACGGFFCEPQVPVLQSGESIAFGVSAGSTADTVAISMAVQINYEGPAERFAWVLPVPAQPAISVGSDLLFSGLFEATRPSFSFTIDNEASTTCTEDQLLDGSVCATFEDAEFDAAASAPQDDEDGDGVIVLETGTVGPYDFTILEAAEGGRPEAIFEWLQENDYDQPTESESLITEYAEMGMKFVAVKLTKEAESGDISPLVMDYELPGDVANTALMCVPIKLTAIAATPSMPIQVYLLGESRGIPLNFANIDLDLRYMDWITCAANGNNQNCFLNEYRMLMQESANEIDGQAFVTEYAGSTDILSDQVALNIDYTALNEATDPNDFLSLLQEAGLPDSPLVHTVIEQWIPNNILESPDTPPFCLTMSNIYTPDQSWMMNSCVPFVIYGDGNEFDSVALANDLKVSVLDAAQSAQDWVNSYPYVTRLYAQQGPEQMNRDPFFAFNAELEDISSEISAVGVPHCVAGEGPAALDITVAASDLDPNVVEEPLRVDATITCGTWRRTNTIILFEETIPALSFTGLNFAGEETVMVSRELESGGFPVPELQAFVTKLDERMVPGGVAESVSPEPSDDDDSSNVESVSPEPSDEDDDSSNVEPVSPQPSDDDVNSNNNSAAPQQTTGITMFTTFLAATTGMILLFEP